MASRVSPRALAWRLTRSRVARTLADALSDLGIQAAKMDRYVLVPGRRPPPRSLDGVAFEAMPAAVVDPGECPVAADLDPDDRVTFARVDGAVAGAVFASVRPVRVPAVGRRTVHGGISLWRLFVSPAHRTRGLATALVARSVADAREQFDPAEVSAFVAVDNYPARRAFERNEFVPAERVTYYRAFGRERRTVVDRRP